MDLKQLLLPTPENDYTPHLLQRTAMGMMFVMILLSFAVVNMQAVFWQSSKWLVGTVLPAVVVDLTNSERKELQAAPLKRNTLLDEAARLKAEDMAKNSYFAHYSPDGISPWHWFDEVSYTYAHAGENLAIHFKDSGAVVDAWMNSPSHRANIVNTNYTEIGVGTAKGKYEGHDTVYVVQMFGTPAKAPVPAQTVAVAPAPKAETPKTVLAQETAQIESDDVEISNVRGSEQLVAENIETQLVSEVEVEKPLETEIIEAEEVVEAPKADEFVVTSNAPQLDVSEGKAVPEEKQLVVAEVFTDESQTSVFSTHFSTSSGLEPVIGSVSGTTANDVNFAGLITRPSVMLQSIYLVLGLFVSVLLLSSIVIGLKHERPLQVVYGVGLLMLMSGLFYVHASLTASVVVAAENPTAQELMLQ